MIFKVRLGAVLLVTLLFATFLTGVAAREEPPADDIAPLIVLVSMQRCCAAQAWPEAEKRIQLELGIMNLQVAVEQATGRDEQSRRMELSELAKKHRAASAIMLIRSSRAMSAGVELWIDDRINKKTTHRKLELLPARKADAATIAALKTIEALKVSLYEIKLLKRELKARSAPKEIESIVAEADVRQEKSSRALTLGMGVSGLGSPGGIGALGAAQLIVGWVTSTRLSFELEGSVSVLGQTVEKGEVGSSFDLATLRVRGAYEVLSTRAFHLSLGLSGGLVILWAQGYSEANHSVKNDRHFVGYGGAMAELGLEITDHLWLKLGLNGGVMEPAARIDLPDGTGEQAQVAEFGRFLVEGALRFEIRFSL